MNTHLPELDTERRRILLVEDETMSRTLLGGVLRAAGFEVMACSSAPEAALAFEAFDPDAMVCDIDLGAGPSGLDLVVSLTRQAPYLAVVIVSNYVITPDYRNDALGRAAYLRKRDLHDTAILISTLEEVLRDRGADSEGETTGGGRLAVLTGTQVQVLRMMAEGLSNEEIARRRAITVKSVEHVTTRIFTALGLGHDTAINPRVAAARLYIAEAGLSPTPEG